MRGAGLTLQWTASGGLARTLATVSREGPVAHPDIVVEQAPPPDEFFELPQRVGRSARVAAPGRALLTNTGSSGLDVAWHPRSDRQVQSLTVQQNRPLRDRVLSWVAPQRSRALVAQSAILYPLLTAAHLQGDTPFHAGLIVVDGAAIVVIGASGVGKSTLADHEERAGSVVLSDNLIVWSPSEGMCHGVQEPRRLAGSTGRRATGGRREQPPSNAAGGSAAPRAVVVLARSAAHGTPQARTASPNETAALLAAGTYTAGELRRLWSFLATVSLAAGRPAHPQITSVANELCLSVPCWSLDLGNRPGPWLTENVERLTKGTQAWT
ncbi:MAG: hypothetical protein ABI720_06725 [Actinomycetes bacterium]